MCCVVFLEVLFFLQTEDNISYDNKIGQQPILPATVMGSSTLMSEHGHASLDISGIRLTLLLWLGEAAEGKQGYQSRVGVWNNWSGNLCTLVSHCTWHHVSGHASGPQSVHQHLELKAAVQFIVDVLYFLIVLYLLVFIRHRRAGDKCGHEKQCLRWTQQVLWCDENVRLVGEVRLLWVMQSLDVETVDAGVQVAGYIG